jgi:hypothetical protein
MTVTIASTTDTEAQVADLNTAANAETPASTPADGASPASETAGASGDEVTADAASVADVESESEGDEGDVEASAETETDDAEVTDESPKRKRRRRGRSYRDRASQLAREKASEQARANHLQDQLNSLRAQQSQRVEPQAEGTAESASEETSTATAEPTTSEASTSGRGKPEQDKFETYEEYAEALMDWKVDQRLTAQESEHRVRIEQDQAQKAHETSVATLHERIDTFREAHPDFDAVVGKGKDLPMTRPMQDSVLNSDLGPAMMYHLSRNPEECDRIARLHPMAAIKEMGKIEARLEDASTGPSSSTSTITKAPKPIKPVGGGATASTVELDTLPYQEFKRQREIQLGIRER